MPDGDMSALRAFARFTDTSATAASGEDDPMAALEARVRSALGVSAGRAGQPAGSGGGRHAPSQGKFGPRRRFVREGDVPVVLATGQLGAVGRNDGQAARRAAEAEGALRAERSKAEGLARDLMRARDAILRMEARVWSAEQERDGAVVVAERAAAERLRAQTDDLEARLAAARNAEQATAAAAHAAMDATLQAERAARAIVERHLISALSKLAETHAQLRAALARIPAAKAPRVRAKASASKAKGAVATKARAKPTTRPKSTAPKKVAVTAATKSTKAVVAAARRPASVARPASAAKTAPARSRGPAKRGAPKAAAARTSASKASRSR